MLRATLTATLATLAVAVVSASAEPDDGSAKLPLASVGVAECARGPAPENRLAVFRGAMRRMPDTHHMSMRFKLQERVGAGSFRTVKAPGLGAWHTSRPSVGRFAYRQRVLALAEGSSYRTIVSFRWYAAGGELIGRTRRRSSACKQPGALSNLRVTRIGGGKPVADVPGTYNYAVHVLNRGQVTAPTFGVSLVVDGGTVDTLAVNALAPGESRRLVFSGPACGSTVTAKADPEDTVREVSERDNTLTTPCPSASGG